MTIFLTGASGFVGSNVCSAFSSEFSFRKFNKADCIVVNEDIVIHLAARAHDLKKTSAPEEYYQVNTQLTEKIFDAFIESDARVFITLSSVKAIADSVEDELTENHVVNPLTHYGKSKLLAEQYILSKKIPLGKRVYILRPCIIHGPGNKGNLSLLYKFVSKGVPWPLGAFENKRSYCSIDNLLFVIKELIEREDIPSGVYNIADDEPLSTNEVISLIAYSQKVNSKIWKVPKKFVQSLAKLGDVLKFPLNQERLQKLTESYLVSNQLIKNAIGKSFPISSKEGLLKTFKSFDTRS